MSSVLMHPHAMLGLGRNRYGQKTLTATQKEEQTKWIREAEARLADPYRRPVRMATAPKVCVCAAQRTRLKAVLTQPPLYAPRAHPAQTLSPQTLM